MITKADSQSFSSQFENIAGLSDINKYEIDQTESYTYHFEYLDSTRNIPYYMQVFFIKIGNNIYSIDIEFPTSNYETMYPAIDEILSTISL